MNKYLNRYFKEDTWLEINTYKYSQHYYLFGKCKLSLQWDSTTEILGWLKLKRPIIMSVG